MCEDGLTNGRNLKLHQKEGHAKTTTYFASSEKGCTSTFLRQSYLSSHLEKKYGLPPAVVQAKTSGAPENFCHAAEHRRRGTPNKVGPISRPEPVSTAATSTMETPMDTDDLISLPILGMKKVCRMGTSGHPRIFLASQPWTWTTLESRMLRKC